MSKIPVYSVKATKTADINFPKDLVADENMQLLAQAIRVYEARSHTGRSVAQTRSEVARTKAKWYRQKGLGRARHGARSAPIFVGGGQAHGPKGNKKTLTLPKKMRLKALKIALGLKLKNKEIAAADGLSALKKTKEAKKLLDKIDGKRFTVILSDKDKSSPLIFRNLAHTKIVRFSDLNAYKVFLGGKLVFDKEIFTKETKK